MKRILSSIIILFLISIKNINSSEIIIWKEDADSMSLDIYSVQKIFTKKINRWPNGRNISVFIKPMNSVEHRQFVIKVLQMTPYGYKEQLERQTYSGKASSVVEVSTDNEMILKVENNVGAVGYLDYQLYAGNKKIIIIDPQQLL